MIAQVQFKLFSKRVTKAIQNLEAGNYKKALDFLTKHIIKNPNDYLAIIMRGECYFNLEEYERAEADFESALEINEDCSKCHYHLGLIYMYRREHEKCAEHLDRAAEIEPESCLIRFYNGLFHFSIENYKIAQNEFEKSLVLCDRVESKILPFLAFCYFQCNDTEKAILTFKEALKFDNENVMIYKYRGIMNYHIANYYEAISDIKKAISLDIEMEKELSSVLNESIGKLN